MNILMQKIIFLIYYSILIFLSFNNLNTESLQSLYDFFDDKDKFMHFIQYFILVMLGLSAFRIAVNLKSFVLILVFIVISSGTSEFFQLYLSSRDSSYIDLAYDMLGGICGFLIFMGLNIICFKN